MPFLSSFGGLGGVAETLQASGPIVIEERPEQRIAKALNVDVAMIVRKRNLLDGICSEAAELLKDKHIAYNTFSELKKMGPMRQIEAAELMIAMNNYTSNYAKSLLAATPQDKLADTEAPKRVRGLSDNPRARALRGSVRDPNLSPPAMGPSATVLAGIAAAIPSLRPIP